MTNLPAYLESLVEIQRAANGPGEVLSFLVALRDDARERLVAKVESRGATLAEERDIRGRRVIRKAIKGG